MDRWKARYAQPTDKRTLGEIIDGADVFLGLSAPGVLKPAMVKAMADKPIIMALANPVPEIMPEDAKERSEGHTSELQSLMRNSYAVFCWKKKNRTQSHKTI